MGAAEKHKRKEKSRKSTKKIPVEGHTPPNTLELLLLDNSRLQTLSHRLKNNEKQKQFGFLHCEHYAPSAG